MAQRAPSPRASAIATARSAWARAAEAWPPNHRVVTHESHGFREASCVGQLRRQTLGNGEALQGTIDLTERIERVPQIEPKIDGEFSIRAALREVLERVERLLKAPRRFQLRATSSCLT